MAYLFYLDRTLLPVAPEKLTVKVKNQNKTMNLINEGEINFLKDAGLTEVEFECLIPAVEYPFAKYSGGFKAPKVFLDKFEKLKTGKNSFQFIVTRTKPDGSMIYNTNITVSMESYNIVENAKEGMDQTVNIKLKQYREFGTKTVEIIEEVATVEPPRQTESSPEPKSADQTYTVVSGDCLWKIAKKFYGNGAKYPTIYSANQALIDGRNKGKKVDKYTIYAGQVFTIPAS